MMVMSGSGERVAFVYGHPGDEALSSGGTIARLRSAGAQVAVLFGSATGHAGAQTAAVQRAMDELDVSDWRLLHQPSTPATPGEHTDEVIREVLERMRATALVIGAADERLSAAASSAAARAGVPVFLATRMSASTPARVTAIDVDDHIDQKLRALAAYSDRWTVSDRAVTLPDGTAYAVTGSEAYVPQPGPHAPGGEARATPLARLGAGIAAFAVGVAYGVLGTIGHQGTVTLGATVVPVGLVLALAGATALLVGLRLILGDRLIVVACAVGLLGTIFVLSLRSTGGSVLVPAGLPGTLWSSVPALVAAIAAGWPKLPASR